MKTKSKGASLIAATALSLSLFAGTVSAHVTPAKHHSKLKGAVVGGVVGHMVGGKKATVAGATAGAMVQHHKNKKEGVR